MMLAAVNGERVLAEPGGRAACPSCGEKVLAKCGEIVSWHWAHENADCDAWSEGETPWHLAWKDRFPRPWQEVIVGPHRADVKTQVCVIEFQHSPISPDEIREREEFYGDMIWVVDASEFHLGVDDVRREYEKVLRWKWPHKSWWAARRPIFLDFGGGVFRIRKMDNDTPCYVRGRVWSSNQLVLTASGPEVMSLFKTNRYQHSKGPLPGLKSKFKYPCGSNSPYKEELY